MYTSTCIMSALLKNTAQYPLTNEFRGLYAKKDILTPKPHYSSDLHLQWVLLGRKSSEKTTEGVFCYCCRTKTLQRVEPLCPNLCGFKQPELPSVLTIKRLNLKLVYICACSGVVFTLASDADSTALLLRFSRQNLFWLKWTRKKNTSSSDKAKRTIVAD